MKISEIFESIQGEGKYTGTPMLFIRLSGCTRKCSYCDTKYHIQGEEWSLSDLVDRINASNKAIVCWTGGEPLLYLKQIREVRQQVAKQFHIETNGDLIDHLQGEKLFDYVVCSPKEKAVAVNVARFRKLGIVDEVKVVTNLEDIGVDMIEYADTLMPLTGGGSEVDNMVKVWQYCVKNNYNFSARIHYLIFGNKKNI